MKLPDRDRVSLFYILSPLCVDSDTCRSLSGKQKLLGMRDMGIEWYRAGRPCNPTKREKRKTTKTRKKERLRRHASSKCTTCETGWSASDEKPKFSTALPAAWAGSKCLDLWTVSVLFSKLENSVSRDSPSWCQFVMNSCGEPTATVPGFG